jgi:hypothetical protein
MLRIFTVLTMLASGTLTSQLPEFAQQYRQRLGGAIDALEQVMADFRRDAADYGLTVPEAIDRQKASADPFIQARGASIERASQRLVHLKDQKSDFEIASPFERIFILVQSPDRELAQATAEDYAPAIPVTPVGLASAGVGAAGGFILIWCLSGLVRLTRRRAPA